MQIIAVISQIRQPHWTVYFFTLILLIFMIFSLYLTMRFLFSNVNTLKSGPFHVRKSFQILLWIAFVSPIIGFLSGVFDTYPRLIKTAISGYAMEEQTLFGFVDMLIQMAVACIVSATAAVGSALVYWKYANVHDKLSDVD